MKIRIFYFGALIILALGCKYTEPAYYEGIDNQKKMAKIRIGMTKAEILAIMGEPLKNETYNKPDVWFYYVEPKWTDNQSTRDECAPVVFEDGKVIGWGNEFYKKNYEYKDWREQIYTLDQQKEQENDIRNISKRIEQGISKAKEESVENQMTDFLSKINKLEENRKKAAAEQDEPQPQNLPAKGKVPDSNVN